MWVQVPPSCTALRQSPTSSFIVLWLLPPAPATEMWLVSIQLPADWHHGQLLGKCLYFSWEAIYIGVPQVTYMIACPSTYSSPLMNRICIPAAIHSLLYNILLVCSRDLTKAEPALRLRHIPLPKHTFFFIRITITCLPFSVSWCSIQWYSVKI